VRRWITIGYFAVGMGVDAWLVRWVLARFGLDPLGFTPIATAGASMLTILLWPVVLVWRAVSRP
jgi:hypothetical protein